MEVLAKNKCHFNLRKIIGFDIYKTACQDKINDFWDSRSLLKWRPMQMCRAILFQKKTLQMTFQCVSDHSLLRSCHRRLESTSTCAALRPPKGDARSLWNYLSSPHRFPSIAGLAPPLWVKEGDFVRERRRQGGQTQEAARAARKKALWGISGFQKACGSWESRARRPRGTLSFCCQRWSAVQIRKTMYKVCFLKSSSNFQNS